MNLFALYIEYRCNGHKIYSHVKGSQQYIIHTQIEWIVGSLDGVLFFQLAADGLNQFSGYMSFSSVT